MLFQAPSPPYQPIDLEQWQQEMHERLETWYKDSPLGENLGSVENGVIETFEVNYHNAVFYLYRPSPNIPTPSDLQLVAMTQAATDMIRLYRQFFREHKLNIYWQAVENLYSAGTALMYAYGHSPRVRELLTFRSLESLVHTCSSALWGMVERFPAFKGKRDAFDLATARILADLGTTFATSGGPPPLSWTAGDGNHRQPGGPQIARQSGTWLHEAGHGRHFSSAGRQPSQQRFFDGPSPGRSEEQFGLALAPVASHGGQEGREHIQDLSLTVFDDLSLVWEAAMGENGDLNPPWV